MDAEMRSQGQWLFRWRSYAPLPLLVLILVELPEFRFIGDSSALDLMWELCCGLVGLLGLAVRAHVVGHAPRRTSGRNTEEGQVAEVLNTTGLYSVTRNPLYVGNLLMWLGVALFLHSWIVVLITIAWFALIYERIILAEEVFLEQKFGEEYRRYAASTPAFLPRLRGYRAPTLPFSARNVLKREYSGLFALVTSLFLLEVIGDWFVERRFQIEPLWAWLFTLNLVFYLGLKALKKRTAILKVPGR